MTIAFRPMVAADRQFVLSGWSSSYRTSIYAGLIRNSTWAEVMHREIGAIIDAPTTAVTVAIEPGEQDHEGREFLYGFIAARNHGAPYVYYVYVKKPYRYPKPFSIGRRLFEAAGVNLGEPFTFASRTAIGDRILGMCTCGRQRSEHGAAVAIAQDGFLSAVRENPQRPGCSRFTSKFPGTWDPVPAREDTP